MSLKSIFASEEVEYLLPSAVGVSIPSELALGAGRQLQFVQNQFAAANYAFSVTDGTPLQDCSVTFVRGPGNLVSAYTNNPFGIVAVAGAGPGVTALLTPAFLSPQLASFLPSNVINVSCGRSAIHSAAGAQTLICDTSIDQNGVFTFTPQNGDVFANLTAYQLGIIAGLPDTAYTLGTWVV